MLRRFLPLLLLAACASPEAEKSSNKPTSGPVIVIHGGAGSISRGSLSEADELAYQTSLSAAVDSGYMWLEQGVAAEEVVARVIEMMESDSLFNSGVGAVVTAEGIAELDASIMRGSDRNAGAVSGLRHIEHPIRLAKMVMDSSKHVMLSTTGAEEYAFSMGMDSVPNSMFITNKRAQQYHRAVQDKHGTVGVVVMDAEGNLAAGTSTGGMMMKEYGRVGDSPIIGAGTYADNAGCAVSCTGHGEYFIRNHVAGQLSLRVQNGEDLESVANNIIFEVLNRQEGAGGLIAIDHMGNVAMPFNTNGMFRGMRNSDTSFVAMYEE